MKFKIYRKDSFSIKDLKNLSDEEKKNRILVEYEKNGKQISKYILELRSLKKSRETSVKVYEKYLKLFKEFSKFEKRYRTFIHIMDILFPNIKEKTEGLILKFSTLNSNMIIFSNQIEEMASESPISYFGDIELDMIDNEIPESLDKLKEQDVKIFGNYIKDLELEILYALLILYNDKFDLTPSYIPSQSKFNFKSSTNVPIDRLKSYTIWKSDLENIPDKKYRNALIKLYLKSIIFVYEYKFSEKAIIKGQLTKRERSIIYIFINPKIFEYLEELINLLHDRTPERNKIDKRILRKLFEEQGDIENQKKILKEDWIGESI
jgi:hypothetical protein